MAFTRTHLVVSVFMSVFIAASAVIGGSLMTKRSFVPQTSVAKESPSPTPTISPTPFR